MSAEPLLERRQRSPGRGRRRRPASRTSAATSSSSASRPGQPLGERLEARVEPGQAARLAERRPRPPRARRCPRPARASRTAAAPRAIASPCWAAVEPGPDLVRLARAEPRRGDLGRLVLEQVEPPGQLARLDRELGERRPVRPPALDGVGHRRRAAAPWPPNASSRSRCQRSSSRRCWSCWPWISTSGPTSSASREAVVGLVVEPRRGAAAGGHLADGDERLRQPVEERLDAGRLRAVADERRVGARAGDQPERVDEQALAGAGLAGDDVEARARASGAAGRSGRGR